MLRILPANESDEVARFDTWTGALWTIVIALDFFWISNPIAVEPFFDESLRRACLTTAIVVLLTLTRIRLPRPSWAVLGVLVFGFASALWSSLPELTVGFTWNYVIIAGLAALIAANADVRTVAQGMALGGVLVLAVSWYALEIQLPGAAVPPGNEGYLAGVGTNRNILAYTLVISLAFGVSFLPRRWWSRGIWAVATASILLGLFLAQSGTGILAAGVLLITAVALGWAQSRERPAIRRGRWLPVVGALALLLAVVVGLELLGRLMGRDTTTLSGRVPLWGATWDATTGADRWVGAGWGAVWQHPWDPAPPNALLIDILDRYGAYLSHGHNSLFDLIPEVGVVGAAIFALTYVHALSHAVAPGGSTRSDGERSDVVRATVLGVLALLLFGLTEPMSTIPIGWFTIAMLATGLTPVARRRSPVPTRDRLPSMATTGTGTDYASASSGGSRVPDLTTQIRRRRDPQHRGGRNRAAGP